MTTVVETMVFGQLGSTGPVGPPGPLGPPGLPGTVVKIPPAVLEVSLGGAGMTSEYPGTGFGFGFEPGRGGRLLNGNPGGKPTGLPA